MISVGITTNAAFFLSTTVHYSDVQSMFFVENEYINVMVCVQGHINVSCYIAANEGTIFKICFGMVVSH